MAIKNPIPALIIGLGGSGATTVMHIKQQLMNTYDDKVPETVGLLVFDTSLTPLAQVSKANLAQLSPREYGHLGGNAKSMVQRAASETPETEHLSSWLCADYYLRSLPDNLFQLEDGAGQLRQLGRLALFKDTANTSTSQFYSLVNDRIQSIRRAAGVGRALSVYIIGSLAGGTGAGLFVDAAYLIRKIGEAIGTEVLMRGYFFLPDAFSATLSRADREGAKPRSFAALREMSRFILHGDYKLGYPMLYQDARFTADLQLWRGRLTTKLYDLIYLVDGKRDRNDMSAIPLETGSSPSVADAILAYIDGDAGEYQRNYIVNIANQVTGRQTRNGLKPYVGSVGSYSFVLPIQQIIEGWSYRLGLDVVRLLLEPSRFDETTRLPLELASNRNPERSFSPEDEVRSLLQARDAIIDPRDTSIRIFPTALWPKIFQWHSQRVANESGVVRQLANNSANDWMSSLQPSAADKGPDAARALTRIDAVMNKTIASEIQLSNEIKADPRDDWRRVTNEVRRLFDSQLGIVQSNGQRAGGTFRDALGDLMQLQVERFRAAMEAYSLIQLNGQTENDKQTARRGKIGWMLAVYNELESILNSVLQLLSRVRSDNRGGISQRDQTLSSLESAENEMREAASAKKGQAHKAQETYRDAADRVLDMYRAEIARDVVEDVVRQMRDFVVSAREGLQTWIRVLATEHEGLYAQFFFGAQRVVSELDKEENLPNRHVIRDQNWTEARYQAYLERRDALNTALGGITWNVLQEKDPAGRPRLRLMLSVSGQTLDNTGRGEWGSKNAEALLRFFRSIFDDARERESVLNYLADYRFKDRPQVLARELFENSGHLLSFDQTDAGNYVPGFYLLAYQDPNYPDAVQFLDQVMRELRGHFKVGEADQTLARLQNSDNPFRLTLVSMVEMVPIDRVNAYVNAKSAYENAPGSERPLLHVFPAEVRVVSYEDQLQRLNQGRRLLSNRVLVLLEDIKRFRDFLALMAHRIIAEDKDYIDQKDNNFVYFLTTPSKAEPHNPDKVDEWWLTEPGPNPSLLDAMTTYIFRQEDIGRKKHEPDYVFPIDYPHVQQHLLNVRQFDTDERIAAGYQQTIGLWRPEMNGWLKDYENKFGITSPQFRALARITVEYDVLREFAEWLEKEQLPVITQERERVHQQLAQGQLPNRLLEDEMNDQYDLYSLALLVLREMMDAKYKDAEMAAGVRRTGR
jgi:hypothetical protein